MFLSSLNIFLLCVIAVLVLVIAVLKRSNINKDAGQAQRSKAAQKAHDTWKSEMEKSLKVGLKIAYTTKDGKHVYMAQDPMSLVTHRVMQGMVQSTFANVNMKAEEMITIITTIKAHLNNHNLNPKEQIRNIWQLVELLAYKVNLAADPKLLINLSMIYTFIEGENLFVQDEKVKDEKLRIIHESEESERFFLSVGLRFTNKLTDFQEKDLLTLMKSEAPTRKELENYIKTLKMEKP